jgi:hypothetical protein
MLSCVNHLDTYYIDTKFEINLLFDWFCSLVVWYSGIRGKSAFGAETLQTFRFSIQLPLAGKIWQCVLSLNADQGDDHFQERFLTWLFSPCVLKFMVFHYDPLDHNFVGGKWAGLWIWAKWKKLRKKHNTLNPLVKEFNKLLPFNFVCLHSRWWAAGVLAQWILLDTVCSIFREHTCCKLTELSDAKWVG